MSKSILRSIRSEYIRRNILRILGSVPGFMRERELLRKLPSSYYRRAKTEISVMLGENILVRTGLGTRSAPFALGLGLRATEGNCPCCGQPIYAGNKLSF